MYYVLTFSLIWGFLYSFFLVACSGSLLQFQFNFTFSEIFISNHFISRIRLSTYCRLTFLSFLLPYFFKFLPKVSQKSNFCLVAPKSVLELAAIQIAHTFLFAYAYASSVLCVCAYFVVTCTTPVLWKNSAFMKLLENIHVSLQHEVRSSKVFN